MSNEQRIQERVQGRKLAQTIIAMAELQSQPPNVVEGFWDHFKAEWLIHDLKKENAEIDKAAMSDEEASAFEKTSIDFGQYRGDTYGNIPLKYLAWVADSGIQLRRYMQSRRAQARED